MPIIQSVMEVSDSKVGEMSEEEFNNVAKANLAAGMAEHIIKNQLLDFAGGPHPTKALHRLYTIKGFLLSYTEYLLLMKELESVKFLLPHNVIIKLKNLLTIETSKKEIIKP